MPFGKTKNKANSLEKYNWILSLDADEAIDEELKKSLLQLSFNNEKIVYDLPFRNFVGDKYLKYGEWGKDSHIRLFNRTAIQWDDAAVHEELIIPATIKMERLKGYVLHRTTNNFQEYEKKMEAYAMLNAEKYFKQRKKIWWGKQWLSPAFAFIQNYIFRLGFLDGRDGYTCARITARYTFLKYKKLKELMKDEQMNKEQRRPK